MIQMLGYTCILLNISTRFCNNHKIYLFVIPFEGVGEAFLVGEALGSAIFKRLFVCLGNYLAYTSLITMTS